MLSQLSLLPDSNLHSLLDSPCPAYTTVTIRRAFIVWQHCGQQNEFRHVCDYFHQLESMEEKLSAEARATSRLHEFNLLTTLPPSSKFLIMHFPKLYRRIKSSKINIKELQDITLEDCVFNLEGFHDLKIQKGATTKENIIKTSQMIRNYCVNHTKSLRILLSEFQNFAKKTEATNSVDNIAMYIKKKYLEDELLTWRIMPKSFSFLDELEDASTELKLVDSATTGVFGEDLSPVISAEDYTFNANKNADKIKTLINETRRKELLNMIPNCQNVLSAKLSSMQKSKPSEGVL